MAEYLDDGETISSSGENLLISSRGLLLICEKRPLGISGSETFNEGRGGRGRDRHGVDALKSGLGATADPLGLSCELERE